MKILLTEYQFKILAEKLILEATEPPWKQENSGMDIDYYEKLGIDKSATKDQIKKAYRKLAVKTHPDNNPNNTESAEIEFKKINSINQILNDDKLRKKYDEWHELVLPLIKQQRQQQQPKQEPPKPKQQQEPKPKTEPKQQQQQQQNAKKADTAIYTGGGSKGSQQGTSVYTGGGSKGGQQGSSSSNTNNNTNNNNNNSGNNSTTGQQSTSSGGGTGGGGTGNTGGNNQQGTPNTNTNTAKKVKKTLLDDDTLAKAYYEAPNLFDIFINLISGREAFEGKGYIKIIDLVYDKVISVKKRLPNLFKYFNFFKDIEFEVLERITFKSTPQYSFVPNKTYKMKMKKSNDINDNITLTSIDNDKIKIKLIKEDIDWMDDVIWVKSYYKDKVNEQIIKIKSEPESFKIKLISKKDTGYYNSKK